MDALGAGARGASVYRCGVGPGYQVSRKVSCRSRGEFEEFCVLSTPLPPGVGSPGLFKTWKKSALNLSLRTSVRLNVLNNDPERLNTHGAGWY